MDWPDYFKKSRDAAMGELALRPHEFYALTPRELEDMCRGCAMRDRKEWEKLAWVAANIMNMWSTKRITVRQLLGPMFEAIEEGIDIKKEMERITEQNKRKFWTKLSDKYAKKES